jgi:hypothetical protein
LRYTSRFGRFTLGIDRVNDGVEQLGAHELDRVGKRRVVETAREDIDDTSELRDGEIVSGVMDQIRYDGVCKGSTVSRALRASERDILERFSTGNAGPNEYSLLEQNVNVRDKGCPGIACEDMSSGH